MSHDLSTEIEPKWPLMLRLSKAYADPLRLEVIAECKRAETSPRRFQEKFSDASLARVLRAFDVLTEYGWLEMTRSEGAGAGPAGADRFYRASEFAVFDDAIWPEVPAPMRALVNSMVFESLTARVAEAREAGTLDSRPDEHMTVTPLALDERGWETVVSRIAALFYSLSQEQEEADARMAETGEKPIPATVGLLAFESPEAAKRAA